MFDVKRSQIREYLQGVAGLFKTAGSDAQRDWHEWQAQVATPVEVCKIADLPVDAKSAVKKALSRFPPEVKACHENSWKLCVADERFSMASGWALGLIPMEHSWNVWTDESGAEWHFDVTAEVALAGAPFGEYAQICRHGAKEARELALETGHSGHYMAEAFMRQGVDAGSSPEGKARVAIR